MTDEAATKRHAFLELDAMRGVAAICVMLYHFTPFLAASTVLPSAYLAVDLFFILSGFIIAHAYRARLLAGMGFMRYAMIRLIRLYPLYIAGTVLGIGYLLLRDVLEPWRVVSTGEWVDPAILSALFLPKLWHTRIVHGLYPFDPAAWSLLFELLVNLAYGAVCVALTPRRLRWIVAVGVIGIITALAVYGSLDLGMTQRTLGGGLARVVLSFFAGVYLYHIYTRHVGADPAKASLRRPRFAFEALMLALVGVFMANPSGMWRQVYDATCVFVFFPLLIWFGAQLPSPRAMRPVYAEAGRLSYGVYILHTPLVLILAGFYKALWHAEPQLTRPFSGIAFACLILLLVALIVRVYDEPVRRRLGRMTAARRMTPALATPRGAD